MKHIDKQQPYPDFVSFVQNEHPTNWDDIHHSKWYPNLYQDCRYEMLVSEQGGLGGYTERPILNSGHLHIDHYRKKGMNWPQDVSFDWNNLIVEERAIQYGACYKDKLTKDVGDYDKLLNPVTDFPEQMMSYLPNGEVLSKTDMDADDKKRVEFTIDRFNLNFPLLRLERETLIKIIVESYADLSDDDVKCALQDNGYPTVVEWALALRKATKTH